MDRASHVALNAFAQAFLGADEPLDDAEKASLLLFWSSYAVGVGRIGVPVVRYHKDGLFKWSLTIRMWDAELPARRFVGADDHEARSHPFGAFVELGVRAVRTLYHHAVEMRGILSQSLEERSVI